MCLSFPFGRSHVTSVDFNRQHIHEQILGAIVLSVPAKGDFSVLRPSRTYELEDLISFSGFRSKSPQVLQRYIWEILSSLS